MRRGPSGFLISFLVHVFACVLLFFALRQPYKTDSRSLTQRFAVRVMELRKQEPTIHPPIQKANLRPDQLPETNPAPGGSPSAAPAPRIPLNFISQKQALQTLAQPDAVTNPTIPQAPLPQLFVWSSRDIPVQKIVQPTPQTTTAIEVRPSPNPPNQETKVADVQISSTVFDAKTPMPNPSKTSPIAVPASQQTQMPETASKDTGKASPASVISASTVQLQEGTATLPMINEVAPAPFTGSLAAGQPKSLSPTGQGKTEGKQAGAGAGQATGNQAGNAAAGTGAGGQRGGANGLSGAEGSVTAGASQPTVVHIMLPKDGKYGVVVVGSSLAEDYPETVNMWRDRLAYTVYLRVGVAKNWILQYSIPRAQVASGGSAIRPDAPWPYDITRPSIDANANTDAIMVPMASSTLLDGSSNWPLSFQLNSLKRSSCSARSNSGNSGPPCRMDRPQQWKYY